jgi:hypothetical protein
VLIALATTASVAAGFDNPASGRQILLAAVATGLTALVAFSQQPPAALPQKNTYERVLSLWSASRKPCMPTGIG